MNRIVIVDTGIDLSCPIFENAKHRIKGISISRNEDMSFCIETTTRNRLCINDEVGHGTAIAGIILNHNPDAELFIVKIFTPETLNTDEQLLVFALEYILENVTFNILNLSLGLCALENNKKLEAICEKYYQSNKIIVSAFDNSGAISFPAAFKNVIGVTNDDSIYQSDQYFVVKNEIVNICAKGRSQKVYWIGGRQYIGKGNSYACAHFTGILSKFNGITDITSLDSIIEKNSSGCINFDNIQSSFVLPNPVKLYRKAVVFPFNKEIHSLIRFSSQLPFELIDVYDIKYSARVGASTNTLLKEQLSKNFIIKNISDINWDSFDTLIIGHTDELSLSTKKDLKKTLIQSALSHGKKIYAFDDISMYINNIDFEQVYYPHVSESHRVEAPFGKLYRQDKPVLGVFGTSSVQGKFTLQLKLRYELIRRGYNLFQLGTEPSSLLYGMDAVFPIGYNSTVKIRGRDSIAYLNKLLYEYTRESDLILVGGQYSVLPVDEGNLNYFNYSAIDMLYGTMPDAVILCINAYDNVDIVKRTIFFIESIISCTVIALSIFPFYYEENDIMQQYLKPMTEEIFEEKFKMKFEKEFGKPIYYPNSDKQIVNLCDRIIDFFT